MSKYKFVETMGCCHFGYTVNDEDLNDIPKEKQKEIVDYICEEIKKGLDDNTVQLQDVVAVFEASDWGGDKENCDTCGDRVTWTIWEL